MCVWGGRGEGGGVTIYNTIGHFQQVFEFQWHEESIILFASTWIHKIHYY